MLAHGIELAFGIESPAREVDWAVAQGVVWSCLVVEDGIGGSWSWVQDWG